MSNLIFIFKAYNPNKRSTYFKHKTYTDYIANSEYVIRNEGTTHGLFGIVDKFPNIQSEENLSNIINYIDDLAKAKVPIYRGLVSLTEFDAERLGYYDQEKWKKLLENRLPSIAEKLNIKFSDLQYLGAVHYEDGHPHLQFFVWSKTNRNYFIKYKEINKMRNEFINDVFKEDLLPIYQDKDLAKKNITGENYILQELKKANLDEKFVRDLMKYQKTTFQNHRVRSVLKDEEIKEIVDAMLLLKDELKNTTGSIKYEYMKVYPEILAKVNDIAIRIIELSPQCQNEIDKYIKAKQKLAEFKYTDNDKLEDAKQKIEEETTEEVIKLIGNQILDIERAWINERSSSMTFIRANNDTRDLFDSILTILEFQANEQNRYNKFYELQLKKHLSKQAKKELSKLKQNSSEFNWDEF
ncbi:MAG: hypothetical protein J6D03_04070 [Clostridia bacterium]|nr:hypothetical protein [Clostridia bacterium]